MCDVIILIYSLHQYNEVFLFFVLSFFILCILRLPGGYYNINTQEELHTQKRMQFDKVLITMGITLESSKIKISIVIALAILHLLCTF